MNVRLSGAPAALNRARRRAGFDRNPMRRREDRIQSAVTAVVVVVLLAFTPWAVATAAGPVYAHGVQAERVEAATRHKVTANVFDPGPKVKGLRVAWQDAHGIRHVGDLQGQRTVGLTSTIWVDRNEHVVAPPHTHSQTISDAALTGFYIVLGILAAAGLGLWLLARELNQRRYRRWDAEWAAVGGSRGRHPHNPDL